MKRLLLILLTASTLTACDAISTKEREQAMNFLLENMPTGDRATLSVDFLEKNADLALKTRHQFEWTRALPDSIFLNEVLPYAVVDEPRHEWRQQFYEIFEPKVRGAKTIQEAISLVNSDINKAVGVDYNTRRRTTNQSPAESMEQGMASCTGLSILLVDAFRSVGIPARFAGTASWHDDRGNHSWVEVWIDGEWKFTEFYPDFRGLDNAWFLSSAGLADASRRDYAVYATSFKPTGDWFPMVWAEGSQAVHAVNVTDHYTARYQQVIAQNSAAGTHVPVRFTMWQDAAHTTHSDERGAANVDVFAGTGANGEPMRQVDGGRTSGPTDDMNKVLVFWLEKNAEYTFMYADAAGNVRQIIFPVGSEAVEVVGYME